MAVGTVARRGAGLLATLLRIVGLLIVLVLVAHIVLTLLEANPGNTFNYEVGKYALYFNLGFSDPIGIHDLFNPIDEKLRVTLNYGLAAIIWYVITTVVVRLVRRIA